MIYPKNYKFAFTILDDTDDSTLSNSKPIYDLLYTLNIKTTKTVWTYDSIKKEDMGPYFAAQSLQDSAYKEWVKTLSEQGFEIAFHNACMSSSKRSTTIKAINYLENHFKRTKLLHCNHGQNLENLYWGADRYSTKLLKYAMKVFEKISKRPIFEGHVDGSKYFWGDISKEKIKYVRAFTYRDINNICIQQSSPFHDKNKPYVNLWFNTADIPDCNSFKKRITKKSINKLLKRNGWTIISTHFGKGYVKNNKVDPYIIDVFNYLSSLQGWYVPVTELLDYVSQNVDVNDQELKMPDRYRMEYMHILDRIISRVV